jgi:16S rRNA (cytidine1402-2'-O)-methyltransferase
MSRTTEAQLYLVPTPIGNLDDITLRAINTLKKVDTILAEDKRNSIKLLNHYEIKTRLESYHAFNEHKRIEDLIDRLEKGETMALISDAGTPAISDPGFLLMRAAVARNIAVECLPGATALIPALVNSALPADRFVFEGFLPHKKGRNKKLQQLAQEERTIISYESPHPLIKTLKQLAEHLGPHRLAAVSRELTKIYEETVRGTLTEIITYFEQKSVKGEFVIVVGPQ